jgi:hypothetical protein
LPDAAQFSFLRISWTNADNWHYSAYPREQFSWSDRLVYYGEPQLRATRMETVYRDLSRTRFASLYSTTNPWDDFAEAFALYVHTQIEHRPYRITISHDGQEVLQYRSCWEEKRCESKRPYIEQLLAPEAGKP